MDESLFDEGYQKIQKALNESKKQMLADKYRACFFEVSSRLPPEIESQWLSYVEEFERQFEHAARVSIRTLLGLPKFKPLEEIPLEQLQATLDNTLDLLYQHGIVVDCVAKVSGEDLYRFITTELIGEEVDDIHLEGGIQCFIYEDFHPNDEYDAKSAAETFLWDLFERHQNFVVSDFSTDETHDSAERLLGPEGVQSIIEAFYASYAAFTDRTFEPVSCLLENEYATVTLQGTWAGLKAGSIEMASHSGRCAIRMKKSIYGGYDVVRVTIPGLEL